MSTFNRSVEELLRAHPEVTGVFQAHQQACTHSGCKLIRKAFLPYFDNPLLHYFSRDQWDQNDYYAESATYMHEISAGFFNEAETDAWHFEVEEDEAAFIQFWQQLHSEEITHEYDTDTPAELTSEERKRLQALSKTPQFRVQIKELLKAVNQLENRLGSQFLISVFGRSVIVTLKCDNE
jgi:hypothetical protein